MNKPTKTLTSTAAVLVFLAAARVSAQTVTLTFDDVTSLGQYSPLGVTFSANASILSLAGRPSVLTNPDGGAYSLPNTLQFGIGGGVLGSIAFSTDMDSISIWALSGPGPDLLSPPMYVRAFDGLDNQIGQDNADPSLQFDFLSITAPGIRRLDLFSPDTNDDVWDDLTITPVPEPTTIYLLMAAGLAVMGWKRLTRRAS